MISHPIAVLPRYITEIPEPIEAKVVVVEAKDVQTTLKLFPTSARLKYLKRIKRNTEGKMEILIDPEQENDCSRTYKDVKIPARSPLSNIEWEKSVKLWPIVRPNCDS